MIVFYKQYLRAGRQNVQNICLWALYKIDNIFDSIQKVFKS